MSTREKESGSLQCAKPRPFIFENNNHNLKIDVSDVRPNPGWEPKQTKGVNISKYYNVVQKLEIITLNFKRIFPLFVLRTVL